MVRAWYMDDDTSTDQRLEHHQNPPHFVNLDELFQLTGVEYFPISIDSYKSDGKLEELKKKRGYTYEDEICCSRDTLPNYEEKLKSFFKEHLHTDEEIRFILEGSGYFDVRDKYDKWIRIEVIPGDLLIVPAGIYHRFTLDEKDYIKAKRLFVGEPVWTPHNRPSDDLPCRKEYLERMQITA
ncbi:1,2-dihydroxy-3-keto-5-methylthiopentene dioxygenase [Agrilus planipennis]|uniref:Acireductone dioxygenase n=1 Tax=Agrilus planipennis TaxID=224129 RepID=A0A1W4XFG1_AGRPL|nr:1,2-dihydroxy-3-keto-5-methylthiopentene dioxygenase [Agrilus planipennis]XP_018334737.1 1,2-dihydroxy-3-keto-5-methylthiopentene dioxygenase [Agrilus planipennis]XP_018334744.1 1,2-dihydroxy-3-keto-5-methylthiopentene dioxygenase [Agrilus planipennis]